jgi:hypothetical protein
MIGHLLSKHEALSSNPTTEQTNKESKERNVLKTFSLSPENIFPPENTFEGFFYLSFEDYFCLPHLQKQDSVEVKIWVRQC